LTVDRPAAVLDANVLYPARLRDLFMRLAIGGLYQARWSDQILDECFTNLLANRPDLRPGSLDRTWALMNVAIPDAIVTGYESLVDGLDLPDPDDRHVLAAAIRSRATSIVTANLADFPSDVLSRHGIEALAPRVLPPVGPSDLDAVVEVVDRQAADLRNPPMSTAELLDCLRVAGLPRTVAALLSGTT
jgi:predicted nucleic acid-binding protein